MRDECSPDLGFFLAVLHTLEDLDVPYMVIGAFAGIVHGMTRATYDIDMVVSLSDQHIDALAAAYPSPRYYSDPVQMRESVAKGMMFNIIDAERGEKADLIPRTPSSSYRSPFARRVRQPVETQGGATFDVCVPVPKM